MPVVLLKTATKQLQEGFQAARNRLSIGRSGSFSDRYASFHDSFSSDSGIASFFSPQSPSACVVSPTIPNPINESNELELSPDTADRVLCPPPQIAPLTPFSRRLFRTRQHSDISNASSRIAAFFRRSGHGTTQT